MRLKSIKLAGFKSFVDPTTAHFPSNLSAVVGPNGCGKSNIIDAVRWVMGESSAKTLRGESMSDVIFNGSNARMPVGQATIELVFDNSDHSLQGEYGKYSEISVRRTVTREMQSIYFLNGSRCRRRDIQDIFLGTGLGPRSYSIIEQGMISRFVDAKPEELRVYIEEAAGISKYKERRRETENRIRHTKENLDRLTDIREELDRQLHHLQRQAKAAEQYSEFKQEERILKAQLQALRWQSLDAAVTEQESLIRDVEVGMEAENAEQRSIESATEKARQLQIEANEHFQQVQTEFYGVGTEIARLEEQVQHQQQRSADLRQDLARIESARERAAEDLTTDQQKIDQLQTEMEKIKPQLNALSEKESASATQLETAEADMQQWQQTWDEFNRDASGPRQRAEVEQSRIQHLEQAIESLRKRIAKLDEEAKGFAQQPEDQLLDAMVAKVDGLEKQAESQTGQVAEIAANIEQQRDQNRTLNQQLDEKRRNTQQAQGRLASLEALQQAALGQKDAPVVEWLEKNQLNKAPRLAQKISVETGWQQAVEVVLGARLQAVCVDDLAKVSEQVSDFDSGELCLVSKDSITAANNPSRDALADKVKSDWNVSALLAGVGIAGDLKQALAVRDSLAPHESVITPEGVWIGPDWLRLVREQDAQSNVLGREEELKQLRADTAKLREDIQACEANLDAGLLKLKNLEQTRASAQQELSGVQREHAQLLSEVGAKRARAEQIKMRHERVSREQDETQGQLAEQEEKLKTTRTAWDESLREVEQNSARGEELMKARDSKRALLDQVRQQARHDKDQAHHMALRQQSVRTQLDGLAQGVARLQVQLTDFAEREGGISDALSQSSEPVAALKTSLAAELEKRLGLEQRLNEARKKLEAVEHELAGLEQQKIKVQRRVEAIRSDLEQKKMQWQGVKVQREAIEQHFVEHKQVLTDVRDALPEEAAEPAWEEKIERIQRRIQRLGAINLAAIDEYKTQAERKTYLDAQNEDLVEALETLENAIRKIDRKTRTKFKETFDQINKGVQTIFPKVFGGGHAYLELTGEDLLDTGVTIMARPPGKRNTSIHLLSGGEKALTAVSLVFAIFLLNPAPFCMLDEVDAPLDDANVGRFCQIVKEMSDKVQFIFITHNKVTMEMASHMMGVTMHEPGVSRLVSVDIDEAAAMAAV